MWRMSFTPIGDKAGRVRRRWHLPVVGRVGSALILTAVAGLVDAAAYLGLGGVFVANQTGNCVLLAIGVAERVRFGEDPAAAPIVGVAGPLTSLVAFCVGAAAAGWLGPRVPRRMKARRPLLGVEALLLAVAAAVPGSNTVRAGVAAAAMGIQSVQAVRLGVQGVTTTVITGTMASLFAGLTAIPGRKPAGWRLAVVWLMYVTGALIGAIGVRLSSFVVVCWCAAAITGLWAAITRGP